jgi:hypothetical protein
MFKFLLLFLIFYYVSKQFRTLRKNDGDDIVDYLNTAT